MVFRNMLGFGGGYLRQYWKRLAGIGTVTMLSAQMIAEKSVKPKLTLTLPDDQPLTTKKIIQNASSVASDSASTLHHQLALALLEAEQAYQEAVDQLVACLTYSIKQGGSRALDDDQIWDKIIQARHDVNERRNAKLEYERMLENTEKLLSLAAEIAFSTGSEYTAIAANERILSIQTKLNFSRKLSTESEERLARTEEKVIGISTGKSTTKTSS